MFKKILQSLSKSQSAKVVATSPAPPPQKSGGVLDRVMKGAPPTASLLAAQAAAQGAPAPQAAAKSALANEAATPEQLCDIAPKMPKDQIYARLKLLYRRYNHSASSLDAKTRGEAEKMLNAIVFVREKHFGQI